MGLIRTRTSKKAYCTACEKDTEWDIRMAEADEIGIVPAYVCKECGKIILSVSWQTYLRTGDVVIPSPKGKR